MRPDQALKQLPPFMPGNELPDQYLYDELFNRLADSRVGTQLRVGRNTVAVWLGSSISIRLHNQPVVGLEPDCATVWANGWVTPTTADRINRAIKHFNWRVDFSDPDNPTVHFDNSQTPKVSMPFFDDTTLYRDGSFNTW